MKKLYPVLQIAHERLSETLRPGDIALDGTAGNGHDTLFLARIVGPRGRVYAFDVQEAAIEATKARLMASGCLHHVKLIQHSHHLADQYVADQHRRHLGAAIFNLGYLPGSDKTIVTRYESTLKALQSVLRLMKRGSVLAIVIYTGHAEGTREREAIRQWVRTLSFITYSVEHSPPMPDRVNPPELLVIYKRNPLSYWLLCLRRALRSLFSKRKS